jgi:pyruvate/oxaloacetate carboxyltransferase
MTTTADTSRDGRKKRLEELLKLIAGCEETIRMTLEVDPGDTKFLTSIRALKKDYYERLKRLSYGLPETSRIPTEV